MIKVGLASSAAQHPKSWLRILTENGPFFLQVKCFSRWSRIRGSV